jgi:EmrB/QacA subfamily drug resistance transporter
MAGAKAAAPPLDGKIIAVALIVAIGGVVTVLDMTIVGVALKTISGYFTVGLSTVQWATTVYILAAAMMVPLTGWATDRFGSKRLWLSALSLFTIGSVACGLAWSVGSLIAFRVVQGIGTGLLVPVGMALVARMAGRERMGRAMSLVGVPLVLGPVLGPVIGGVLVDTVSWRWIFLINLPVGVIAFALAWFVFDRDERSTPERIDLLGFVLLCPGIVLLLYGVVNVTSVDGLGSMAFLVPSLTGAALLVSFVVHALRAEKPLLDLRLFRNGTFSAAVAIHFVLGATLNGSMLLFPLYFLIVRGESPTVSGLLLVCQGLGVAMMMPIAGRLVDKGRPGLVVLGGIPLILLGFLSYTQAGSDGGMVRLCVSLWLIGVGSGCTMMPAMAAAYGALSHEQMPRATATFGIVQDISASIAVALFIVVLDAQLDQHRPDPSTAFDITFWIPLALSIAGVLPAILLARRSGRRAEESLVSA